MMRQLWSLEFPDGTFTEPLDYFDIVHVVDRVVDARGAVGFRIGEMSSRIEFNLIGQVDPKYGRNRGEISLWAREISDRWEPKYAAQVRDDRGLRTDGEFDSVMVRQPRPERPVPAGALPPKPSPARRAVAR